MPNALKKNFKTFVFQNFKISMVHLQLGLDVFTDMLMEPLKLLFVQLSMGKLDK